MLFRPGKENVTMKDSPTGKAALELTFYIERICI